VDSISAILTDGTGTVQRTPYLHFQEFYWREREMGLFEIMPEDDKKRKQWLGWRILP